ncbi:hypothetical protein C8J98_101345 [Luteibacter sp. OK325]|uniref:hypothetical protein n=1 Tax=Luteibacter sp. OK325 TaxID=2135670 RepID=UPI000D3A3EB1|nr:hypothetical protein [Luteibacter sp. OK325]PTR35083.1 hypothetical protein C8J98_101345 [Luteibacter sp. OK325]
MIVMMTWFNLVCSSLIAATALWQVTDATQPRLERLCMTLLACGAVVNVVGVSEAVAGTSTGLLSHAFVWPSEAALNLGAAAMLMRWSYAARKNPGTTGRRPQE